jgi:hypothetical protein
MPTAEFYQKQIDTCTRPHGVTGRKILKTHVNHSLFSLTLILLMWRIEWANSSPIYISNKMQLYTVYLYLETALHVSGGTSTNHQERIHLYLQHLVFVTPLLIPAAIVEELELVWVRVRHPQHTQTSSNSSTIAAGSSNGVTITRCCRYSCMRS